MFKRQYQIECGRCHQGVFIDQHKGPRRKYCDKCDPIVKGEQSAERMKELRNRRSKEKKTPRPAKRQEPSVAPVLSRAGVKGETPLADALLHRPSLVLRTMPNFTALMESRRVAPVTF